jgi:hypothetical protein
MNKKIFSIPLNPFLTREYFIGTFLPFLEEHQDYIYDIYFTSRIPPFVQDAMGGFIRPEDRDTVWENALEIQKEIGIGVSATFNNINVSPRYDNYKLFIENFKQLYDKGVRSATIPHAHWVAMGLKKHFPSLKIKNTILRKVCTAQDYVLAAEQGFDYVNVDRILMRDHESLKEIRRAQDYVQQKYDRFVEIALLTNEGCLGRCPMMDEHYSYNNLKQASELPYFKHEISKVTCEYKWEHETNAFFFKAATIPPFKEDYDELLNYVQVFKMHGRDNLDRLNESLAIVKNYARGGETLCDSSEVYLDGVPHEELRGWRKKIKTCKFQCWNCNYCDALAGSKKNASNN